jgi:mono/diheme cytochrome c family protein
MRDLRSSSVCNSATLGRLSSIIADGLEGTSMPAWRSVLDRDEIEGIAAYVRVAFCRDFRSTP